MLTISQRGVATRYKVGQKREWEKQCDTCNKSFVAASGARKRCPDCCKCKNCNKQLPNAAHEFCSVSCGSTGKNRKKVRLKDQLRKCFDCKQFKSISQFHKRTPTNQRSSDISERCKKCTRIYSSEYYKSNRESIRNKTYQRHYGITVADYEQMRKQQGGRCAICLTLGDKLHVDHCHKSTKVRGLLCGRCNKGLGLFKDEPERLQRAMHYLLRGVN